MCFACTFSPNFQNPTKKLTKFSSVALVDRDRIAVAKIW